MATLIRSVRNELTNDITLRLPGYDANNVVTLAPSVIVDLMDRLSIDQLKSMQELLSGMVTRGSISSQATIDSEDIGLDDIASVGTVEDKADKTTAIVIANSAVTAVANAATQTALYVDADVQTIADLANDLKAKYNAMVALVNDLKVKVNAMNA